MCLVLIFFSKLSYDSGDISLNIKKQKQTKKHKVKKCFSIYRVGIVPWITQCPWKAVTCINDTLTAYILKQIL